MVRTGLGGGIPGYDPGGGGSDDGGGGSDDGGGGTTGGGSIPGAPSDGGSSNDSGFDANDPTDAPSARGDRGGGVDADDPRDAPSARGGGIDTGGGTTGGGSIPGAPSDGADGGSGGGSSGGSSGGGIGERITSTLEDLGQQYTDTVAEPVGDFSRATNPISQVERRTVGTDAVGNVAEGVGEGVAQIGNIPGNAAAGIRAGQALAEASARSRDQVTIGGVPTGVALPNPSGQRENAQAAGNVAAGAAASAASSPFETTGQLIGGALGGAAIARGARAAGSAARSSPDVDTNGAVATGRSDVGTDGLGSILDEDTARALQGRDTSVDRSPNTPSTRSSGGEGGDLPLRDELQDAGGVRRLLDEQRAGIRDFLDEGGTDRGQVQFGSQGRGTRSPDTGSGGPQRFTDFDGTDRVSDDLVRESIDRRQRANRRAIDEGDFEGVGDPFGPGTRRGTITEGGDVQLTRSTASPDTVSPTTSGAGTAGGGTGGAALGSIAGVNDPTGIVPGSGGAESGFEPAQILGAGPASGGGDTGTADPTALGNTFGANRNTGSDTGSDTGGDLTTGGDTDAGGDTDMVTGTGGDAGTAPVTDEFTALTPGTDTPSAFASPAATGATLTDPATASETLVDPVNRPGGRGFGGGGGGGGRPRGREEEPDDEDDAQPLAGFATDEDTFGSGIASAEEFLR